MDGNILRLQTETEIGKKRTNQLKNEWLFAPFIDVNEMMLFINCPDVNPPQS